MLTCVAPAHPPACLPAPLQKLSGSVNSTEACKYIYRVAVTGPLSYSLEQLLDLGVSMLGNALGSNSNNNDVTCDSYQQTLAFCAYWPKAKMCYTYPWSDQVQYKCQFEV